MDEIEEVVKELETEAKALKHELYKMAWFMRGAMSIEEAFTMDVADREIIGKIIQDNIETTKETKLPFF